MLYSGQCHCGKLKAAFDTQKTPQALGVRTCQCDFCRRVGAVNISDPEGRTVIDAAPDDLIRYRFALRTADFLICRHCGVYIAAVTGAAPDIRATVNVAGLRMADFLSVQEAPAEYGAETLAERIARRSANWTPTRFTHPDLNTSFFGPH